MVEAAVAQVVAMVEEVTTEVEAAMVETEVVEAIVVVEKVMVVVTAEEAAMVEEKAMVKTEVVEAAMAEVIAMVEEVIHVLLCIRQRVEHVMFLAKFHFDQTVESRFFAAIVSEEREIVVEVTTIDHNALTKLHFLGLLML